MIDEQKVNTNKLGSSGEPAKFLVYDDYKGFKLSVKPESANYVCNYLRNDVSIQLEDMLEMVNAAYKEITDYAGKSYVLPASFDKSQAVKAIIRAIDSCTNAASQVYNLSDAICKYGAGGWLSEQSIFNHLNEFITSSNVPNNSNNVSAKVSPTEVIGADIGGNIVTGADSKTDYILDIASNEIFISTKSDVIFDFSSCVVDSFSSVTETIFMEMTNNSQDVDNTDVSNSLVHQILGSAGLAAASAVALGGKVIYDMKKEKAISEMRENDNDADDDDDEDGDRFLYSRSSSSALSDVTWRSKANVVDMKKELFNIGQDQLSEEEALELKKELFGVPESKNKVTNMVSPDKLRKEIYSYVKDITPNKDEIIDMKKELFGINSNEGFSREDIMDMKKDLFGINSDEEFSKEDIMDMKKDLFGIGEDGDN